MASEFDLIRRYFTRPMRHTRLGPGDDCALIDAAPGASLAISTDMLVEGRHFLPGADPFLLGHKTLAVNLSDLAAMGAMPRWATLSAALPRADESWLATFARGFFALAERFEVDVVGGDTTRGPLNLCLTIVGELPAEQALRRDAAKVGDDVWVSGELGGAALALAHLQDRTSLAAADRAHLLARLHAPEPRVALGLALRGVAHAAIDVSDGFAADLGHILQRSGVGAHVEVDGLPRAAAVASHGDRRLALHCVLAGGDDYELVFTAPVEARDAVLAAGARAGVAVTRAGRIVREPGLRLLDAAGRPLELDVTGFDHFA